MKRASLGIAMLVAGGAALAWWALRGESPVAGAVSKTVAVPSSASVPVAVSKAATQTASATETVTIPVAALSKETHDQLSEIARLDRKAFLSEEEKRFRADLLRDEKFLNEIAKVLASRSLDQNTKREQYQAIDVLLDAQAAGSTNAAALLAGVVKDASVENEAISKDVRENLAGVKAEVLFKWTAQDRTAQPSSLLPGPVSRQIWANVQDSQTRNESESRSLKH